MRFGPGALAEAPELLARRGFEGYALLTTERAAAQAPPLSARAGAVLIVPGGAVPEAAAALRHEVAGRPIVALGGGRVVDSAKAIAGADGLPCAAVPTTLSGAEMTRWHRMPAGVDVYGLVRPSLVIAEPALLASQPMPGLAASAMNALAHAVEALYAPWANPVAEMAALRAAELLSRALCSDEPDRPALALGAVLAGYAVGATGFALLHVVCQTLVRVAGTPHAMTYAVMLPPTLRFMAERAPREIGHLAIAVGAAEANPEAAAARVAHLAARAGATRLGDLGVGGETLDAVVAQILARPELRNTPGAPTGPEVRALLESAL